MKRYPVPTGVIKIIEGDKGPLECLSLGDYGKAVNLSEKRVSHTELMPLTDKWVCTISSQYGCSMGCTFCDVPKVGPGVNATLADLDKQVEAVLDEHPTVKECGRFNIHYARMGEPTFNPAVLWHAVRVKEKLQLFNVHPVVSTMMPWKNRDLEWFLKTWMHIKNDVYNGDAGLQISINSTNDCQRREMFRGNETSLPYISEILRWLPAARGRKVTLNFAVAGWEIDPDKLSAYFNPAFYAVKLTPMHKTASAVGAGIKTEGIYTTPEPYVKIAADLRAVGYEVLVFIASDEEDMSKITCGNAILSDEATP